MAYREIPPHGGNLVNRLVQEKEKPELIKMAGNLKKLVLNDREISDLEMISTGAFSPLEGFLLKEDYLSVVEKMHLKNGLAWSMPVTLAIDRDEASRIKEGQEVALYNKGNSLQGLLEIEQIYSYDKKQEASLVFKTQDPSHPGVAYLYSQGELLAGGKVKMINRPDHSNFKKFWFDPAETRRIFREKGWRRIVGFQTRNPIHRAHEFVIKTAMEVCDGLLLNPLVGETKEGDIPAEIRMACYQKLIDNYFPKDRVFLAVYGAAMRYAGPREAILHALVRKNFGCTHFIVGRDHAGVGNFYGPFDAQKIFDEFEPHELEITPLFFDNSFYCVQCQGMATVKVCPHMDKDHLSFSGTKVRELLKAGEIPPPEFTRPEIAEILIQAYREGKL
ncbi:MAG: sulfate adenylyltransferase [Candidatus Tectomicrobia bacterium]|uniref:Sulfate adenylyltransferase n=1 Tax=Tectimicrobiota bacterium TaxID=2528274 RepID=A0A933GMT2_UNCTE|nr:sulfate adenylyltransferase [Candidatus Tectomicrobia bacterium]